MGWSSNNISKSFIYPCIIRILVETRIDFFLAINIINNTKIFFIDETFLIMWLFFFSIFFSSIKSIVSFLNDEQWEMLWSIFMNVEIFQGLRMLTSFLCVISTNCDYSSLFLLDLYSPPLHFFSLYINLLFACSYFIFLNEKRTLNL